MQLKHAILDLIFFGAIFSAIYLAFNQPVGLEPKIDRELSPIVDEWKSHLNSAGLDYQRGFNRVDSIILIDSMERDIAGHYNKANGCIRISKNQIESGPYSARAVVFHELGHYVFDLEHCINCIIMNPNLISEEYYRTHWNEAITEYINQCAENEFEAKY